MLRPLVALALFLLPACVAPIRDVDVQGMLDVQASAWNRGDLVAFMEPYWDSDALTFVGSSGVTRGYDETLARYQKAYPDAATRGQLRFELLDVRPLGQGGAALVLGRFYLEREEPASGTFSLVVERLPEGLRITHDHSSADSQD
ncbi:MAG: YybH family protein [Planctomycetota bacterium]